MSSQPSRVFEPETLERAFRTLIDQSPAAVYLKDLDGRYIAANRRACELIGVAIDELIGLRVSDVFPPDIATDVQEHDQLVVRTGRPVEAREVAFGPGRTGRRTYRSIRFPVKDPHGEVVAVGGISSDVTEAERSRALLRLLRRVAMTANEVDRPEVAIQTCIAQVCDVTGWPVGHAFVPEGAELVSSGLWCLTDGERFGRFREVTEATRLAPGQGFIGRIYETGRPDWVTDVMTDDGFVRRAGERDLGVSAAFAFPVRMGEETVAVLEFFSGEPQEPDIELLDVMRDVGIQLGRVYDRKAAREAMEDALDALRAADELKNTFLQAISHDMRAPLTVLLGTSKTLSERDDIPPDKVRELLGSLGKQAERLDRILISMLDLDRLRRGALHPIRERVALAPIVERVVHLLEVTDRTEFSVEVEEADVDPAQFERIIENLLNNAVKHTPEGTRIWVDVEPADDGIVLAVSDAGLGVPAAERERIFEMFQRGPDSAGRTGLGIGLSLVAQFARLHGGEAWVSDRDGGGAAFHVHLPEG